MICSDSVLQVPTPEIRAHSLYFDLSAYGIDTVKEPRNSCQPVAKPGFHLKIYGTFRNRCMALACTSEADSKMMHFLRHTANSSVRHHNPSMHLFDNFICFQVLGILCILKGSSKNKNAVLLLPSRTFWLKYCQLVFQTRLNAKQL